MLSHGQSRKSASEGKRRENLNSSKGTTMSQKTDILAYLQEHHDITPIDALNEFGCFRLADVIFRLRADGYYILTDRFETKTGARPARYIYVSGLKKPEKPKGENVLPLLDGA